MYTYPLLPPLLALLALLALTHAKAKPTTTLSAAYPCLSIATSHQSGVTKLAPNLTALANYNAVWFLTEACKIGGKSFKYECGDEECCHNTDDYAGWDYEATLPKGWYVYGCTTYSMCVGRDKGQQANVYQGGGGDVDYQWDCDGEIA